ncbi:GAF domain-containing protein [Mollicutes bacterium LVI A0078]|nr:GAF domain-containing protein [Mollicutes bacterium LVI A0075]WOO90101.1 GAF domain-containing protein [Mollicutes bacterium LVI A0078]
MNNIKFLINEYVKADNQIVSNLANISSILYNQIEDINWLGFYLADNDKQELYLGPFQGLQATTNINYQNGVCGHCATTKETIVVPDVHCFEGHIACDLNSKSEIVVPVFDKSGKLYAVLDVDSPIVNRFTEKEQQFFEEIAELITEVL